MNPAFSQPSRVLPGAGRRAAFLILLVITSGAESANTPPIANFTDIAEKAGLTMSNVFGGKDTKKYIIETTGTGVAIFDYDNDGWPDILVTDGHIEDQIEKVQKRVSYAEPPHVFRADE